MRTALLPTAAAVLALACPAFAGLNKCVDADGNVTYRQTACPGSDTAQEIATAPDPTAGRSPGAAACGAVRKLAKEAAGAMKEGISAPDVIEHMGGVGGIDPHLLAVVNYVYGFDGQRRTSVAQIAGLAERKCHAGGFGMQRADPGAARQAAKSAPATGSGFVVNAGGDVLTNHHVVDGCGSIRVQHGERWHDATLTHSRAGTDLAILRVADLNTRPAVFSSAPEATLGETVIAAGYPLQDMLSRQVNVTSGIVSANAGIREEATHMQITVPIQPGNSGGPVLDAQGRVKGVAVGKLSDSYTMRTVGVVPQNVNFAVKGAVVRDFLTDTGIPHQSAPPAGRLSTEAIARQAQGFTVFVECYR
jgi:S1-C subfamily serine protease